MNTAITGVGVVSFDRAVLKSLMGLAESGLHNQFFMQMPTQAML